jgi:hypothetical protein
VAQLLRDNAADSRVLDDLSTLAGAYDEQAVAATAAAQRDAQVDDLALLTEAFGEARNDTPWWRDVAEQVLRYRAWVSVAVVVLAVIVFVSPAPKPLASGDEGNTALIPTSDAAHAAANAAATQVAPTAPIDDPFDFSVAAEAPSDDTFAATTPTTFDTTPQTYAPAPSVLRISQSGYASRFAPTPAEQEPADGGLPVQAVAGQVVRYSYVRLNGSGTVVKLRATGVDAANSETARVQLCHITTAGWKPSRATPMSEAPKYNAECVEGHSTNTTAWTFNFGVFNPVDPNGWAIVPITAGNATFDVTFAPTAAE